MRCAEIKGNERWILSCDGGGIRGIITLQCLKFLEEYCNAQCHEIFDMFAGTSTGAIIAGGLASKKLTVGELIRIYRDRRDEFFTRTWSSYLLGRLVTKYQKRALHEMLRATFGDMQLQHCTKDVMITATDTVISETIYFSYFKNNGKPYGKYGAIRLRDAIEASVSAPTYFAPHYSFVDGGVGTYNNPCYAAAVEALRYSAGQTSDRVYKAGAVRVLSFGTGAQVNNMEPGEAMTRSNLDWLDYIIGEGMDQANSQQSYICYSEAHHKEFCHMEPTPRVPAVKFFRYQIVLNKETLSNIGVNLPPDFDPATLTFDALDDELFEILSQIGIGFGRRLSEQDFYLTNPDGHQEPYNCREATHREPSDLQNEFDKIDKE